MTIKSRIHEYGNEKESDWPPKYGTRKAGVGYWDKETNSYKEGYPPIREKLGQAPSVIFDSMPGEYHQGAGRVIDSRKEWERADKEAGTLTFGSKDQAEPKVDQAFKRQQESRERKKAIRKTLQAWEQSPKEMKQKITKRREIQREVAEKSGLDNLIDKSIKESI